MPKNKPTGRATLPRKLIEGLVQAFDLIERQKTDEALKILTELDAAYPNQPEILEYLCDIYLTREDWLQYEYFIQRLSSLKPGSPGLVFNLAVAHMQNYRVTLALRAYKIFLRHWPQHANASTAREEVSRIEQHIQERTREPKLTYEQELELQTQSEEQHAALDHGEFHKSRQIGEKLLRKFPNYIPALNNLSQAYVALGEFEKAIQLMQRVLETQPENIHALSNLARFSFLRGRLVEAQQYAARLKQSPAKASERWTKIAEALTWIEDDEGVLAIYEQAKAANQSEPPYANAFFYHLLAVAAYHLGKEGDARDYWQKSLRIAPNYMLARENLNDLQRPIAERQGAWAFPATSWQIDLFIADISALVKNTKLIPDKAAFQRALTDKYPEMLFLAPHMIARGDRVAREFVVRIAAASAHPILVEAAKNYVLGQRGTYEQRTQAFQQLAKAGLMQPSPLRVWRDARWQDVVLTYTKIYYDAPSHDHPQAVHELYLQSIKALQAKDGQRAQAMLEKALALWPDAPDLLNNLAAVYEQQGKTEQAYAMLRDIHARFPDYFFGISGVANMALNAGDYETAHRLLGPLLLRPELHISEYIAMCKLQINLALAEGNRDIALNSLDAWRKAAPEDPGISDYQWWIEDALKKKKV